MKTVGCYRAMDSGGFCTVTPLYFPHPPSRAIVLQVFQFSLFLLPASSPLWGRNAFLVTFLFYLRRTPQKSGVARRWNHGFIWQFLRTEAAFSESLLKFSSHSTFALSHRYVLFFPPQIAWSIGLMYHAFKPSHIWVSFCLEPFLEFGLQWAIPSSIKLAITNTVWNIKCVQCQRFA